MNRKSFHKERGGGEQEKMVQPPWNVLPALTPMAKSENLPNKQASKLKMWLTDIALYFISFRFLPTVNEKSIRKTYGFKHALSPFFLLRNRRKLVCEKWRSLKQNMTLKNSKKGDKPHLRISSANGKVSAPAWPERHALSQFQSARSANRYPKMCNNLWQNA